MTRLNLQAARALLAAAALGMSSLASAFDVAGLKIGDSMAQFEALSGPAKDFVEVTPDDNGRIVRILYRQEGLENDEATQKKLVNSICNKYGRVTPCYSALAEIDDTDTQFLSFFHLYRNKERTEELRARIKRTKAFSLVPDLTVEIDLMDSNYAKSLREQKSNASSLIGF